MNYTVNPDHLAELIDKMFAHSPTRLDGYATLPVYSGGILLSVTVSNNRLEIMETLQPSLCVEFLNLADLFEYGSAYGLRRHHSIRDRTV